MNGKRKLKERVLSLVLAFAMVVSMVIEPLQIRAADASADADAQIEGEPMLLDEESGMGEDDTEEDGTEEDGPEEDNTEEDVDDSVESAITLDKESLELQVGDEGALTPTTAPEGSTVEWESDNEDVATVNDGTVTAMGVGEATITASLQDDPSVQAIATVTVSEKIYTVTGKVFGTSQAGIEGATVSFQGDAGNPVSATTGSEGAYLIDLPEGSYTVSAEKAGFVKQELENPVYINNESTVVSDITLNLNEATLTTDVTSIGVSGETTWTAAIPDFEGDTTVTWKSSSTDVATVDESSGIISGISAGTSTITATVSTQYGNAEASSDITVTETSTITTLAATPEGGDKVESVTLNAMVSNETNTDKKLNEGSVTFTISKSLDEGVTWSRQTEEVAVSDGSASYSLIQENDYGLSGKYKFKAAYSGVENKYSASASDEIGEYDYEDLIPMSFMENGETINIDNPKEVTYGEEYQIEVNKEAFSTAADLTDVQAEQVTYTYAVGKDDLSQATLSVTENGNVTCFKACEGQIVYITVTREDIGNHKGISVDFPITVNRKTLEIDTSYDGLKYSKIYDKTDFTVSENNDTKDSMTGVKEIPFVAGGVEENDEVYVQALTGTIIIPESYVNVQVDKDGAVIPYDDKADVEFKDVTLDGKQKANYKIEVSEEKPVILKTEITINPREIKLKVSGGERQYGHWADGVTYDDAEPVQEDKSAYDRVDIEGLIDGDSVAYPIPREGAVTDTPDYALGKHEGKLTVVSTVDGGNPNGNAGSNYYFDFDNVKKGALTVTEESITDYKDYVEFPEEGTNVYISPTEGNKIWVDSASTSFHVNPQKMGKGAYYNQIILVSDSSVISTDDKNKTGINFSGGQYEDAEENIITVQLKHTENGATSKEFEIPLFIDTKNPVVTETSITNGIQDIADNLWQTITFGKFNKTKVQETAKVSDNEGSGIKRWDYNVMTGADDEAFTKEDIEAYVDPKADTCTWTEISVKDENSDNAVLEGSIELPDEENNYVTLLKVQDNVGHSKVYASNGVIVDYTEPKASISLAEDQFTSNTGVYNGDVKLKVHVEDIVEEVNSPQSAIKKVDIQVENNETVTQTETLLDIGTETKKSAWTIKELDKYRSKDWDYTVEATKNNSNNVTVTVRVTDNADNEYTSAVFPLMIDTTDPEIDVEYTSKATAKNDFYYNKSRTAEITYTERNFSEEYLWFNVAVEGKEADKYSVDELESLGIKAEWEELSLEIQQDEYDLKDFTDERKHKLILTFDKDDHYIFTPYIKDMSETAAGGTEFKVKEEEFVIDQTAPEISLTYDLLQGTDKENPSYFGAKRTATVIFTERNFDSENAKIEFETKVAVNKDSKEEKEAKKVTTLYSYTFASLKQALDETDGSLDGCIRIVSAKDTLEDAGENNLTDVRTNTYKIEFLGDAEYEITALSCEDKAGTTTEKEINVEETAYKFNVDTTAPDYAKISIAEKSWVSEFFDTITFHLFSNEGVQIMMEANDKDSGVKAIEYHEADKGMTKKDLDAIKKWTPYAEPIDENPDQQFVYYMKVTNYGGVYTYYSSDGQIVEETEPKITIHKPKENVYKDDTELEIIIEDPVKGNTYSGIKYAEYRIVARGNVEKDSGWMVLKDRSDNEVQNNTSVNKDITVSAAEYNSNDVTVYVRAEDYSGNISEAGIDLPEKNKQELALDSTKPKMSVTYDNNTPTHDKYFSKKRTATVVFTERNFDPKNTKISITATDAKKELSKGEFAFGEVEKFGNEGKVVILDGLAEIKKISDSQVERESKTLTDDRAVTYEVAFKGDANYTIDSIVVTDLAGNETKTDAGAKDTEYVNTNGSAVPYEFTVDKTAPETGKVTIGEKSWVKKFFATITFGLFSKDSVEVKLEGSDNVSLVEPLRYYIKKFKADEKNPELTKPQLEAEAVWEEGSSFSVNPNEKFAVYLKVTNYAGLTEYYSSNGAIVDNKNPESTITITNLTEPKNGFYTEDVKLRIDVKDPTVNDAYAGLKEVYYTVKAEGNVVKQETLSLLKDEDMTKQGTNVFSSEVTIPAGKYNSNNVTVQAFAEDKAGNSQGSEILKLKLDITKPKISLNYDFVQGTDKNYPSYFGAKRTATVTFTERNFDSSKAKIAFTTVTAKNSGVPKDKLKTETKDYSYNFSSFKKGTPILGGRAKIVSAEDTQEKVSEKNLTDSRTNTYVIEFLGDAEYEITALSCEDKAGWKTEKDKVTTNAKATAYKFNVDTSAPDYTKISVAENFWINKFFDTITFHLFSNKDVKVTMEANDKDSFVKTIEYYKTTKAMTLDEVKAVKNWKVYKNPLTEKPEKEFVYYMKVTNYGGNVVYYSSDGQIVDTTDPIITITQTKVPELGIYTTDADVNIHIEDPTSGDTYSGIKYAEYRIVARGSVEKDSGWTVLEDRSGKKVQSAAPVDKNIKVSVAEYNSNDVTVYVRAEDYSGNITEQGMDLPVNNKTELAVDVSMPKISVAYDDNEPTHGSYFSKARTATVSFTERNFNPENTKISMTATDVDGNKLSEGEYIFGSGSEVLDGFAVITKKQDTEAQNVWKALTDNRTITYEITFRGDANYTIQSIVTTDLAGNMTQTSVNVADTADVTTNGNAAPYAFTVDKTVPEKGKITIGENSWAEQFIQTITFGLFFKDGAEVSLEGSDNISPVEPLRYYFKKIEAGKEQEQVSREELANLGDEYWAEGSTFHVNPNEKFAVYLKVTNYAGLTEYYSSDGAIVDNANPQPKVTITNLSQAENGIFNENVLLQIDVEDPTVNDTYAGLEKVWYTIAATGNVTAGETIELLNNENVRRMGSNVFSQVITVPANVYNSNDVKVQAFATDFSGNTGESEFTELKIDITAPTISVAWDLNNPLNGKYYKDTRTATVTVTDRNFDENNVRFNITNTDGTAANIGGWSSSAGIGVSDSATSSCQVSFPADGDYTFTLGCTDLAGNSVEYGQTDEFTIDKTIPVMTVSYDNNNARNGNYYKETRTATVTVNEHNFNAAEVRAAITASLQGSGIAAPSIGGFSTSGDVHTATVSYTTDGDYTFDVDYTDMAGNQAADYTPDSFTVDLKAPEVEIVDIEDKSANNDVVSPMVKASDVNYDASNVTVSITGTNNGAVDVGKVISAIENGQSIKVNDFARDEKMDDLYKLSAKAVDRAGNETEKSVLFSVNRYGSVYVLDGDTTDWLSTADDDYTYINQEQELGIIEYNVDEIESGRITVNRDGELAELKENRDYTVKRSGSDVQWKETHYTLNADNFAEEGNYKVILNTQDRANNAVNNTSVKKSEGKLPIEFTVDKTAPTVVVSGVEDGGRYRSAEKNLTVDAKDNLALAEVNVSVDGKNTVYTAEDLRGEDGIIGVIEMSVASANDWQDIEVSAKDMAGNIIGQTKDSKEVKPVVLRVLVTSNIWYQFYRNKPLFFSFLAVMAGMAGFGIFFLRKKRTGSKK